ncbi:MAG: flippase [Candidatus Binatia bacterium]
MAHVGRGETKRTDEDMSEGLRIQGNLLAKNTALNFIGQIIPLVIAVVTIPYILHGLGVERFGILSLAWVVLGYFSLFDLGLGRAATRFVAEALGKGEPERIPAIVWTCLALQTMLGVIGGTALAIATPVLVGKILNISENLWEETKISFYLLSIAVPIVLCSGSLKGVLEARQRFDLVNAVRMSSSSLAFMLPAVAIFMGFQLPGVVLFLIISMVGAGVTYLLICFKVFPSLTELFCTSPAVVKHLFTYGGWVTLCNVIIPLLIYSDRFLIGALVSVSVLGYYTVPFEMASRLQIFPWSFGTTLFPAFSTVAAFQKEDLGRLYARSLKYLLLMMGPIVLAVILFSGDILQLWLGKDFSVKGTLVLQILVVGMLLNALSQIPANLLDGVGRPDLRAKIFVSYVGVYIGLAWFLITKMGIVGAALAWALRGALELGLFFGVVLRLFRFDGVIFVENGLVRGLITFGCFAAIVPAIVTASGESLWIQNTTTVICFMVFGSFSWWYVLDQEDRRGLKAVFLQWAQ